MDAEIVFTGLCSFLNLRNKNPLMPPASVILVQTRRDPDGMDMDMSMVPTSHEHIPFIAYNQLRSTVTVKDAAGNEIDPNTLFQDVDLSPAHRFMRIEGGHLISLPGDAAVAGKPDVDPSYDGKDAAGNEVKDANGNKITGVARRDDYWKAAIDNFNRDYVPDPKSRVDKPLKTSVEAFMRFGSGTISAGRISTIEWIFEDQNGTVVHSGFFPEEVIYSDFPHAADSVTVELRDIETEDLKHVLQFKPNEGVSPLTLHIGNNMKDDIDDAVQRLITKLLDPTRVGDHFKFLNLTAKLSGAPLPKAVAPPPSPAPPAGGANGGGGGGTAGGACGPNNGNS